MKEPLNSGEDHEYNLRENLVDSFIGKDAIPQAKTTSSRFWLECLKMLGRLVVPRANQKAFAVGFWLMRAVGAAIALSWLFFGAATGVWDNDKLAGGMITLLFGPLSLRGTEFLLEYFLLSGTGRDHWRHFWSFKRMVAPRTIQGAFYLGFWVLGLSGAAIVCAGFHDLIVQQRAGSIRLAVLSITENMNDADALARNIMEANNPFTRMIQKKLSPGTLEELQRADKSHPLPPSLRTAISSETVQIMSEHSMLELSKQKDPSQPLPQAIINSLPSELKDILKTKPNAYSRILKGFLLMVFGPLALRLTVEYVILFFRINETLTDISRQLELVNRRLEEFRKKEEE